MEKYQKPDPDDPVIEKIFAYIRVGADFVVALRACGISEAKIVEWQKKMEGAADLGESDQYRKLYEAVLQAEALAQIIALQRLSAEGGASGAKWLIEKLSKKSEEKEGDSENWPF
jgi:hypothetical protein